MKKILLLVLTIWANEISAQNKNTVFYDSAGQLTTFEGHWSQVVTGRYKSVYNKPENTKTLVKTTTEEFETELRKTDKRIRKTQKLGTDFPDFDVLDLNGNRLTKQDLKGKVIALNFWFVGCGPCEMERPELNALAQLYESNENVVFISFAKNNEEQLRTFLADHPFKFKPVPTDKDEIKTKFEVDSYPVTVIIDKEGKYSFYGNGTGIGISYILKREIDTALNR